MAGLQVASSLAQGAADAKSLRRQARAARDDASAQAARFNAQAEYTRDRAERDSATARARASMTSIDPLSESVVASLADNHARSLDPALQQEAAARDALASGEIQAQTLKRASRNAVYRSLLGNAGTLLNRGVGGNVIAIPR
jgi:hypothetical protein